MPSWFAWDAIRALDYLLSRPEVDPARVGMTGCSGGGTMTTWMWGLDERLTMAAPSCFVTTFLSNLEDEIPADAEQYPVGVLAAGLEQADFYLARAPKPVILLGDRYDFFDRRGTQEAFAEMQRFYGLLGAPEGSLAYYEGPDAHGFRRADMEEMVRFFARQAGIATVRRVPRTEHLDASVLAATPTGNVIEAGGTPVYAMTGKRAQELAKSRPALSAEALRATLRELLGIKEPPGVPHYRNLRPERADGAAYARCAVETEGASGRSCASAWPSRSGPMRWRWRERRGCTCRTFRPRRKLASPDPAALQGRATCMPWTCAAWARRCRTMPSTFGTTTTWTTCCTGTGSCSGRATWAGASSTCSAL